MNNNTLRDYQIECLDTIKRVFQEKNRQLVQLPTGSGKTYIFLNYIKESSNKCLIICPTKELLDQIEESAETLGISSDIFVKRREGFKKSKHILLTMASLTRKETLGFLKQQKFDTIIVDEAHKAHCKTYLNFLKEYSQSNTEFKLLGFTATPERLDKKPLLEIFGQLTFEMSIFSLIEQGFLCDIESYRIKTEHKLITRSNKQDFSNKELKKLDCDSRNQLIYKTYSENCPGKKTLIFCISIEHADRVAQFFKDKGLKAESIYGDKSINERRAILSRFKDGQTQILTNCQLLTEGFDAPWIEAIIIARPTRSKALYTQMVGRGIRKFPNKNICFLYELTDNSHHICTFNVLASTDIDFEYEYRQGIKLTDLDKELKAMSLSEFEIKKQKINLFKSFNDYMDNIEATPNHIEKLNNFGINFHNSISSLEASFLLWKKELARKYGFN